VSAHDAEEGEWIEREGAIRDDEEYQNDYAGAVEVLRSLYTGRMQRGYGPIDSGRWLVGVVKSVASGDMDSALVFLFYFYDRYGLPALLRATARALEVQS
jgi:hypothetical protein